MILLVVLCNDNYWQYNDNVLLILLLFIRIE